MPVSEVGKLTSITSANKVNAEVFSSTASVAELEVLARKIRRHIVSMIGKAGSGHPGGSLSAVEIVTALWFKIMRHKPQDPCWPERDRFVLSKGHAEVDPQSGVRKNGVLRNTVSGGGGIMHGPAYEHAISFIKGDDVGQDRVVSAMVDPHTIAGVAEVARRRDICANEVTGDDRA